MYFFNIKKSLFVWLGSVVFMVYREPYRVFEVHQKCLQESKVVIKKKKYFMRY